MRIFLIIGLLAFTKIYGQVNVSNRSNDPVSYLIKNVLLHNRDSGSIVLIPLKVESKIHIDKSKEIEYWKVLKKYFKNISTDSLKIFVQKISWINKSKYISNYTIYFPDETKDYDLEKLFKKYNYVPVFMISNPIFSTDNTTCILYVSGYNEGPFTIEIKKDINGIWNSHIITTDWLF